MEIARERSIEFYAFNSGRRHSTQQSRKRCCTVKCFESGIGGRPIAVHVLSDQMNFLRALPTQFKNIAYDRRGGKAYFPTAGKRHNAVCAKFVAAFDDRNECDVRRVSLSVRNRPVVI